MRSNYRLVLIGVLVFIFPLIFIWVSQIFYTTAYTNITTAEKLRIGMVHDVLSALLRDGLTTPELLNTSIRQIESDNTDITKLTVYQETPNGLLAVAAANEDLIGTYDPIAEPIRDLGFSNAHDFLRLEFIIDGDRVWQSTKRITLDNDYYYIFSEQNFRLADDNMSYRRQQSYYPLTAIYLFLISLAFWIHRQTNWQARYEQLAATLRERDLFSNMIAHEFRSPLTAIKGYASFLEESKTMPPDERRFAGNIRHSAEHLVALVSDFLEVARLQSGKLKLDKKDTDMHAVIRTVIESLQGMAAEKHLQLKFAPTGRPIHFVTDASRLQQVLTNLITNAIKYTNSGSVEISCSEGYRSVIIRVMDTGMGISAEHQKKLFSPFTREGGVDSTATTGTGLGMYITLQLVGLLGGTVDVESIKGVGTHLVVTLTEE